MIVPRDIVESILKELDPEGMEQRMTHKLKRRTYHNQGSNDVWHCDEYHKLRPFSFPIHGCIDGCQSESRSRKVLWVCVTRSKNSPQHLGGCPRKLVSDLGTENGIIAAMQSFFRDDLNAHYYVPSRNQRIKSWWSQYRKSRSTWWINFFKDLGDNRVFNQANELESEAMWFCFAPLLQADLDEMKHHWNTHYIRKSRHDTDRIFYTFCLS